MPKKEKVWNSRPGGALDIECLDQRQKEARENYGI